MRNFLNEKDARYVTKYLKAENKKHLKVLMPLPESEWKHIKTDPTPDLVYRSSKFVVQVFKGTPLRLTINRTMIQSNGDWKDGITWEEIQTIKKECGFKDRAAVEIYPPDKYIQNVANMRHIWILNTPPEYMWK